MNKMIKVGIVFDTTGMTLGNHGTHLAFIGLPGVETVGFVDPNGKDLENRVNIVRAKRGFLDYRDMIEREKPDIVAVCSRLPTSHFEVIKFAAEHGCHILCEKPLCATLAEADALAAVGQRCRVHIAVAHLARFALVFRTMKKMIEAGAIGTPLTFYGRGKEDKRGGGEDMLVLGTHILDLGAWLFGAPTEIYGEVLQNGRPIVAGDDLPTSEPLGRVAGDDVFATFRFPNGVRGVFESRRNIFKEQIRMGVTVAGTAGALAVRYDLKRELRLSRSPYPPEDEAAFEAVPLVEDMTIPGAEPVDYSLNPAHPPWYFADNNRFAAWDLIQSIRYGRKPTADVTDARLVMELINGIYRSSLERRQISLPPADRFEPLHD